MSATPREMHSHTIRVHSTQRTAKDMRVTSCLQILPRNKAVRRVINIWVISLWSRGRAEMRRRTMQAARAWSTAVKKSGIPNTIPATESASLAIPASNARFWGRRPSDFELDVETRDAGQNNTETGSPNRTRAGQETKHDQAQDRSQTESAPATSARRTRQAQPEGTGRKPDTSSDSLRNVAALFSPEIMNLRARSSPRPWSVHTCREMPQNPTPPLTLGISMLALHDHGHETLVVDDKRANSCTKQDMPTPGPEGTQHLEGQMAIALAPV